MTQRALTATLVARIPIALFFIVRSPLITSKSRRRVTAARTYQHLYVHREFPDVAAHKLSVLLAARRRSDRVSERVRLWHKADMANS